MQCRAEIFYVIKDVDTAHGIVATRPACEPVNSLVEDPPDPIGVTGQSFAQKREHGWGRFVRIYLTTTGQQSSRDLPSACPDIGDAPLRKLKAAPVPGRPEAALNEWWSRSSWYCEAIRCHTVVSEAVRPHVSHSPLTSKSSQVTS